MTTIIEPLEQQTVHMHGSANEPRGLYEGFVVIPMIKMIPLSSIV